MFACFVSGEDLVPKQAIQIQEADEARRRSDRRQRFGQWPRTIQRLTLRCTCLELAYHREDLRGDARALHPQLHVVVPHHAP